MQEKSNKSRQSYYLRLDLFNSSLIHCKSFCISASLVSILIQSISSVFLSNSLILQLRELQVAHNQKTNTSNSTRVEGSVIKL